MSFRRKEYDGDFPGGSPGFAERRDTFTGKGKIGVNAPTKRTNKNTGLITAVETVFQEDSDKDRYLITYADLITLLLGLFIILYAISNIDSIKYQKLVSAIGNTFGPSQVTQGPITVPKEITPLSSLKNDIETITEKYGYTKVINVEENERGVTIHILEDIMFKSGSAELNENSRLVLSRLASILKQIPNDIRIEGHSDNVPINTVLYPSNWHLSVSRALNTAYQLITQEELPADKISICGYSEFKPIASNETMDGRMLNRRVDLVIIKK